MLNFSLVASCDETLVDCLSCPSLGLIAKRFSEKEIGGEPAFLNPRRPEPRIAHPGRREELVVVDLLDRRHPIFLASPRGGARERLRQPPFRQNFEGETGRAPARRGLISLLRRFYEVQVLEIVGVVWGHRIGVENVATL